MQQVGKKEKFKLKNQYKISVFSLGFELLILVTI